MSAALKLCPQCGTEYPANARFCEIDGTALRSAAGNEDLVGSIVADRYHVMKKLGEGGMGQVYLVEHVKMGRKSALKVMHPGMVKDVDAISRFNREAANASRISHPNVASVYDFGETTDGIIYLAMEFVDGPPLTAIIEQAGALPPKRAAEIVRQTAEALAVAHDMGIVHRDLKPDNIMVAKTRDGADLVKVVDFGIAKAAGNEAQKVTKTGLVVGTPEYMSPEQLAGDKLDGRSDIYSLGLVAFNMLTGVLPFPSDSAQESMIMRLTDRPRTLAEMRPTVAWPADVQAVMDHALERDANARYQNATEFGRDLVRAVDRMPETTAGELRTQVMETPGAPPVPATRVAPPSPSSPPPAGLGSVAPGMPGAPGTMSVPTPGADASQRITPPVAHDTAPRRKNPMLAGAGAVVVLALVGVGGYFAMHSRSAAADTTGKTNSSVVTPQTMPAGGAGPAGYPGGGSEPPAPVTTQAGNASSGVPGANGRQSGAPGTPSVTGTGGTGAADAFQPVGVILSRLEDQAKAASKNDTKDDGTPDKILGQLSGLWGRSNQDERARINYVRYWTYLWKNDGDKACSAIKDAINGATDPAVKSTYTGYAANCQ